MEEYDVRFNARVVGSVCMIEQGLYWQINCKCAELDDGMYRLVMVCRSNQHNLGICLKTHDGYVVRTKIPRKHIIGTPSFNLENAQQTAPAFYPIVPGQPINCLDKLPEAQLAVQDGIVGIKIAT